MFILRALYGEDRVMGHEFPQDHQTKAIADMRKEFSEVEMYLYEKHVQRMELETDPKDRKYKDMNPDGFWECQFTVGGLRYTSQLKNTSADLRNDWRIVKVVSQGLLNSDPTYINKIVYMLRHPYAVAKSQERLHRELKIIGADGQTYNLYEGLVIHSPEMFIQVTMQAMRFIVMNPEIPIKIFNYEDLIEDPRSVIPEMVKFIGMNGDIESAVKLVKPKLNRSDKYEPPESELWGDALLLHNAMLNFKKDGDRQMLESILEAMQDPMRPIHLKNRSYHCYRAKRVVNYHHCQMCRENIVFRKNLIKQSEALDGTSKFTENWRLEPCVYECGMGADIESPMPLADSIENNFWEHNVPINKLGDQE
jgi:hypothetical protein